MAGKCGCGGARVAPQISADSCSALANTPAGLLVPRTEVEGLGPGTAVGTARSVDIDVTPPAAGDCPAAWTVGARLTPLWGEIGPTAPVDLNTVASATWADIPGFALTAPEAGAYRIAADVTGGVTTENTTAFNRLVSVVLALNGAILGTSVRHMFQLNWSTATAQVVGLNASVTISRILQLAAGDVVQVRTAHFGGPGAPPALLSGTVGGSLLAWDKVAD